MGGANGSRDRAPDDRLRDTHQLQAARMMGFAALYPSYIVERNPACAGEMAGPLSRTSIAAGQSNGLIGFICIPRYRIVRPEFIAASGS